MTLLYQKQRIEVEEIAESGDHADDLHYSEETLFRDADGNYYLRRMRAQKMPPNAEEIYDKQIARLMRSWRIDEDEVDRLRAFRDRHEQPRITTKRITERAALLWCACLAIGDARIKARLREAIVKAG